MTKNRIKKEKDGNEYSFLKKGLPCGELLSIYGLYKLYKFVFQKGINFLIWKRSVIFYRAVVHRLSRMFVLAACPVTRKVPGGGGMTKKCQCVRKQKHDMIVES